MKTSEIKIKVTEAQYKKLYNIVYYKVYDLKQKNPCFTDMLSNFDNEIWEEMKSILEIKTNERKPSSRLHS